VQGKCLVQLDSDGGNVKITKNY